MDIRAFDIAALPRGEKQIVELEVTTLPDGSPLRLMGMTVTGALAGPLVVVLAGVHGDEYEGMLAIPEIYQRLQPAEMAGSVVMVPACNVPAFQSATRSSPID